ncbi:MAG: nicotinate-nucleotide--dimethylbenzimidazole phosphoribosyltransferase [Lachnospiraceae bacterium]|nr:nicotinate-nucleotide--dimethylbenzimidazole phosphoribosyltransferase [Lachnospiraceae bacterium]
MTLTDLYNLSIPPIPSTFAASAKRIWDSVAHPLDGLGALEDDICRIAAAQGRELPDLTKKALVIYCADNGVVREGVSQCGSDVTRKVAELMGRGKSSVGMMTKDYPIDIFTVDTGIDSEDMIAGVIDRKIRRGSGNIVKEAAMSEGECLKAVECGMDMVRELAQKAYGIIATGEMGIGNTTTSTAVLCALLGLKPEEVTGRGAGLSDEGLDMKISVIKKALMFHGMSATTSDLSKGYAFDVLRCLGGFDIAAIAGTFIGGALYHVPVVIDGLISAAAALCAEIMVPGCRMYMLASHNGKEKGCAPVLEKLKIDTVIDADLALGEGSGAVLLLPMLDMALNLYKAGTAFAGTGIDSYKRFEQ